MSFMMKPVLNCNKGFFMSLNIFKPKWKHSDPAVRKKAIKELTDLSILAVILKKDKAKSVHNEAEKKIADIAENNKNFSNR